MRTDAPPRRGEATGNGCLFARRGAGPWWRRSWSLAVAFLLVFGAASGGEPDWTRPGGALSLPSRPSSSVRADALAPSGRRLAVGEVAAMEGMARRRSAGGAAATQPLQIGDAVHVGDWIEVGDAGAVEVVFGRNARLRIGGGGVVRLLAMEEETRGRQRTTRREVELLEGAMRARVKRNLLQSSQVFLVSGDAALLLERGDAALETEPESPERVIRVLDGGVEVLLREGGKGAWGARRVVDVSARESLRIPDPPDAAPLRPRTMEKEEIETLREALAFSPDRARDALPPPPPDDRELDGP